MKFREFSMTVLCIAIADGTISDIATVGMTGAY